MNKIGHVSVTKRLSLDISGVDRLCFVLGSILPDIFVHTYIVGHKWDTTFEKNCKRLASLERWGCHNCYSYLKLGYVIHYIEDYFTYPHNSIYEDAMKEHVKYEMQFQEYIQQMGDVSVEPAEMLMTTEALTDWLGKLHKQYLAEPVHNHELDYKYITKAAQMVSECMVAVFERNENKVFDLVDIGPDLDLPGDVDFGLSIKERV